MPGETGYPVLGQVEGIFKDLVWDAEVQAALTALFVTVPGLSYWPLRQIVTYAVTRFSDQLFFGVRLITDVSAIRLVNAEHQKTYDAASIKCRVMLVDYGPDSKEFREAKDAAKVALSRFVRFGA